MNSKFLKMMNEDLKGMASGTADKNRGDTNA